jgi:hypothetical protein
MVSTDAPEAAAFTERDKERVRTHNLGDPIVQTMLSGFLHQELRNNHDVIVPPDQLRSALMSYVDAIDVLLDIAVRFQAAGIKPHDL